MQNERNKSEEENLRNILDLVYSYGNGEVTAYIHDNLPYKLV